MWVISKKLKVSVQVSSSKRRVLAKPGHITFFSLLAPDRKIQYFGSPMLLLTVEGPKVPLSRGLFGSVALRYGAMRRNAPSP